MKLVDLMRENLICEDLTETSKETVLQALVDHLVDRGEIEDGDEILGLLMEREQMMTTGVRTGFAIPHAFSDQVQDSIVALGRVPKGINWQSLDQEPVHYVFLILGPPQSAGTHLRLLAQLSRVLSNPNLPQRLERAQTPAELLQAVALTESEVEKDRPAVAAEVKSDPILKMIADGVRGPGRRVLPE